MTRAARRSWIRTRNTLRPFLWIAAAAAVVFLALVMVRSTAHAGAHLAQATIRPR